MRVRLFVGLGLGALTLPAVVWAQGASGDPASNWAAIAACAASQETEQRHQCMDAILRQAGVLSDAQVVQSARQEFGRDSQPEPPRVASAPPPAPAAGPSVAAAPPRPVEVSEVVTTIAAVRTVPYRRLRVTTAEGTIWEQTQAETFNTSPRVGDAFTIERGALGSYRCRFKNLSAYHCERVD